MLPPTWQHMPRSTGTSRIRCSVFWSILSPLSFIRERRITPLNFRKSAAVPNSGASPSFSAAVSGLSAGVFSGGE